METASERRKRKLQLLCDANGGPSGVAAHADVSAPSLDQVLKGTLLPPKADGSRTPRSLGDAAARKIERAYGLRQGWFDSETDVMPPQAAPVRGVAHQESDFRRILPPQQVEWRGIVEAKTKLQDEFQVAVPDDALAPEIRAGWMVQCDPREPPRFGDAVIVRDGEGAVHFRRYSQGRGGSWEATATAPGFLSLNSEADGLEVLAVVMFTMRPRGA